MIKKIRFFIQLLFFIFAFVFFLGLIENQSLVQLYNSFHILPSLSYLAWFIFPPFFTITLIIILLPLFLGRLYCAFMCPVGFIQDIVRKIGSLLKMVPRKSKGRYVSLLVLGFCLFLLAKRSSLQGYFDHFSNFGRLINIWSQEISYSYLVVLVFMFVILLLPVFFPRWFCQVLCPSGAIFSIFNNRSFLNIESTDKCSACGLCDRACPTNCIDLGKIDKKNCITCFECLESCPQKAFQAKFVWSIFRKKIDAHQVSNRRQLIFNGAGLLFGIGSGWATKYLFHISNNRNIKNIIPPGGKSVFQFIKRCTGCNLCVAVCPTKVIKLSSGDHGFLAWSKPKMDYNHSYCSYQCNTCMAVCPSGALSFYPLKCKKQIKIGQAAINTSLCVSYVKKLDCGACAEHCPTGAVEMQLRDGVYVPVMDGKYCIGCGACQHACPTVPTKSIIVSNHQIHQVAYDPRKKSKPLPKGDDTNEFPF